VKDWFKAKSKNILFRWPQEILLNELLAGQLRRRIKNFTYVRKSISTVMGYRPKGRDSLPNATFATAFENSGPSLLNFVYEKITSQGSEGGWSLKLNTHNQVLSTSGT
jgi:hypothetical protein